MFSQTLGSTVLGLHGRIITVEVDIANGLPALDIVGLPDTAVKESRERVRAAIKNSGFEFPVRRITVNLAPADIKKDGSGLDLPIAIGILAASGQIDKTEAARYVYVGELSLEGKIRGIFGILPIILACRQQQQFLIAVSPENAQEALLAGDITVFAPQSLKELVLHLRSEIPLKAFTDMTAEQMPPDEIGEDFADVHGQLLAKRAIEIAAAGGHNLLMAGPPGSGKTMLAKRINSILPSMSREEALEVTKIYSVAGYLKNNGALVNRRPFRDPHHTISPAGMIGGGSVPRPGEVTLSHFGVLFLDELPEFPRQVLEVLRQPLEDGQVTISRVNASFSYPSAFMLVASMNPCPCGFSSDSEHNCTCTPHEIKMYLKKISGPLLDRMDILVHVPRLNYSEITGLGPVESSPVIRQRVEAARRLQQERYAKTGINCNARMRHREIKRHCQLTPDAQFLLKEAFHRMKLSARGYDRVLKVSRTIADLAYAEVINAAHVAEAVQFRISDEFLSGNT